MQQGSVQIANPIYDIVFKYLMEDGHSAMTILSLLLGEEIIDLEPLPQEFSAEKDNLSQKLSIYRLDFSATVRTPGGSKKTIIIEVQKSATPGDIIRFRKYLGTQYRNSTLSQDIIDLDGRYTKVGFPIFSIYFLGYTLPGFDQHPVMHIDVHARPRYLEDVSVTKPAFIESLYHQGIIITIPALKKRRRDRLEQLLSIFDQSNRTKDIHIMNVQIKDFPRQFQPIIRRLQKASQVQEVRETMEVEDDFFLEINELVQAKEEAQRKQEEAQRKQEEAQRKQAEAQRKQEEAQRKQAEAQRKQAEAQRKQEEAILFMLDSGISRKSIVQKLNISIEELERIISKGNS